MPDALWNAIEDTDFSAEIGRGRLYQKGQPLRGSEVTELEAKPGSFYYIHINNVLVALDVNPDGSLSLSVEFYGPLNVFRADLTDKSGKLLVPRDANTMTLENLDAY